MKRSGDVVCGYLQSQLVDHFALRLLANSDEKILQKAREQGVMDSDGDPKFWFTFKLVDWEGRDEEVLG